MRRTDTLIVGGGPAGSAAAIMLARAGHRPLVIERDAEPRDALCGGFLSWATVARLASLDIDPFTLGAQRVERLAIFAGTRSADAALPAPAAALSRRALDIALIDRARMGGAAIERGIGARTFAEDSVRLDDGATITAEHLVLATGKHDLRGLARPRDGKGAVGLRWRLGWSPALMRMLEGRIELHLFEGGYAGLVMQEDGANLCLALDRTRLAAVEGRPEALLEAVAAEAPVLALRLGAAQAISAAQAIANVPYGWRARTAVKGLYRIGDQAGVIPSLAGEGIAIALASGAAAAEGILRGTDYQLPFARRLRRPMAIAGALRHLAERPAGADLLLTATRIAPSLADLAARLTRIA